MNLQIRTQPTVQRFRQTGGAVEQAKDVPYRAHHRLESFWHVRGDVQVQGLTVLPSPKHECLCFAIHLLKNGIQLLLQPLYRRKELR